MPDPVIADLGVGRFLDSLASADPVPGGGAAAAVAGAAAGALLQMVVSLALRRGKGSAEAVVLTSLRGRAHALRQEFVELAEADVTAYRHVADTLALPRSTAQEEAHRAAVLQQALVRAAEVPRSTARLAVEALVLATEVAPLCPRAARSDLVTAIHLLRAACASALANVDANALSLEESPVRRELARACTDLATSARARTEELLSRLEPALGTWRGP